MCLQHSIYYLYILLLVIYSFIFVFYHITIIFSATSDNLFWKLSCVAIEKETAQWRKYPESVNSYTINNSYHSTIDALLLIEVGSTHLRVHFGHLSFSYQYVCDFNIGWSSWYSWCSRSQFVLLENSR